MARPAKHRGASIQQALLLIYTLIASLIGFGKMGNAVPDFLVGCRSKFAENQPVRRSWACAFSRMDNQLPGMVTRVVARRKPPIPSLTLSFQLEIAAFRRVDGESIDAYLPDVFGYSNNDVSFEDATSVRMNGRLAATQHDEYVLVIDTACRLTGLPDLLGSTNTKSLSACVVRIADEPIEQTFDNRVRTTQSLGSHAIKDNAKLNDVGDDGEDVAVAAFAKRTGIAFPMDLFDLSFRVYEMD